MNGRCVEGEMKEKKKKWILDILTDIAGGLLLSIAIYSFAVPADWILMTLFERLPVSA